MGINALKMDERDNVVTCVKEVKRGEDVVYQAGASEMSLVAEEAIPYCHKVALSDLAEGTEIIKYGESLGKLVASVKKGHWVNDKNLKSVPPSSWMPNETTGLLVIFWIFSRSAACGTVSQPRPMMTTP